jgi:predicted transcriptional regulator
MSTPYQQVVLVMDYLRSLGATSCEILDAVCDENREKSYNLIKENPKITRMEFLEKMDIEEG